MQKEYFGEEVGANVKENKREYCEEYVVEEAGGEVAVVRYITQERVEEDARFC